MARAADLPASVIDGLSGHSTRVGAAQDMIGAGIELPSNRVVLIPGDEVLRTEDEIAEQEAEEAAQAEGGAPDPEMLQLSMQREIEQARMAMQMQLAELEHETAMMRLASEQQIRFEDIAARLEGIRRQAASRERVFAAEAAVEAAKPPGAAGDFCRHDRGCDAAARPRDRCRERGPGGGARARGRGMSDRFRLGPGTPETRALVCWAGSRSRSRASSASGRPAARPTSGRNTCAGGCRRGGGFRRWRSRRPRRRSTARRCRGLTTGVGSSFLATIPCRLSP